MNANELRISNWIFANTIKMEVCIAAQGIYEVEQNQNDYEPIPLTPEILEKCGFKNNMLKIGESDYPEARLTFLYEDYVLRLAKTSEGFLFAKPIYHLHQLQNLYFALTGTELEINL